MAEEYDHTLRLRLTRLNLQAAGIEISSNKSVEKSSSVVGGIGDTFRGLGQKIGF
jgi:COP9 signalosome complex subunit 1